MTASQRLIVATLPAPPTVAPVIPAPSTGGTALPSSPVAHIDGTRVPVVPAFVTAFFAGTGVPTVLFKPSSPTITAGSGVGSLTATARYSQSCVPNFGGTGSATARVAGGVGSRIVVNASFGADTNASSASAGLTGLGVLATATAVYAGARPAFYARGTATA